MGCPVHSSTGAGLGWGAAVEPGSGVPVRVVQVYKLGNDGGAVSGKMVAHPQSSPSLEARENRGTGAASSVFTVLVLDPTLTLVLHKIPFLFSSPCFWRLLYPSENFRMFKTDEGMEKKANRYLSILNR